MNGCRIQSLVSLLSTYIQMKLLSLHRELLARRCLVQNIQAEDDCYDCKPIEASLPERKEHCFNFPWIDKTTAWPWLDEITLQNESVTEKSRLLLSEIITWWASQTLSLSIKIYIVQNASINPFATGDVYMRQLFHCLEWYAGSERVKWKNARGNLEWCHNGNPKYATVLLLSTIHLMLVRCPIEYKLLHSR